MLAVGAVEVLEVAREVVQRQRARIHRPERVEDVAHRHLASADCRSWSTPRSGSVYCWSGCVVRKRRESRSRRGSTGASGRRRRTPRSTDTATPCSAVFVPGMPRSTSFPVRSGRAACRASRPRGPTSSRSAPSRVVGCAMIAGVQSTVWIFAISAATTRRALSNRARRPISPDASRARWSQTALCSRMNSDMQQREPDPEVARDAGEVDVRLDRLRNQAAVVELQLAVLAGAQLPARTSDRAAVDLRAVPPVGVGGDEGRRRRRSPRSGRGASAGSPSAVAATGRRRRARSSRGSSCSFSPWLNQSCTSNWIHAAASRLSVVAGMNSFRVSSSRLTVRGFGSSGFFSFTVCSSGTLRPKRLPRLPINGSSRLLKVPSSVRAVM